MLEASENRVVVTPQEAEWLKQNANMPAISEGEASAEESGYILEMLRWMPEAEKEIEQTKKNGKKKKHTQM